MTRWLAYMTSDGSRHYLNVAEIGKDARVIPLTLTQRARLLQQLAASVGKDVAALDIEMPKGKT